MHGINYVKKGIFNSIKIMIRGLLSQIEKKFCKLKTAVDGD